MTLFYIGLGGALGAVARYLSSSWIFRAAGDYLPFGTLGVNIIGSFILGFIYVLSLNTTALSSDMRVFLTIGFLGSYTTFSTFSLETVNLIREGLWLNCSIYILGSVVICVMAVFAGMLLANYIINGSW